MRKPESAKHQLMLGAIVLLSFLLKMYLLLQLPHFQGMDSGYYVWHTRDTMEGDIYMGEPPLAFLSSALLGLIAGGSAMLGVKLAMALFSSLMAVPFYLVVKEILGRERFALSAAFIGAFSDINWWMVNGHLKNTMGLFFGLFVMYLFLRSLRDCSGRNLSLLALSLALMVLSHFSSSAFIVAGLFPAAIAILAYTIWRSPDDRPAIKASIALALMVVAAISLTLLWRSDIIGERSVGSISLDTSPEQGLAWGNGLLINHSISNLNTWLAALSLLGIIMLWKAGRRHASLLFLFWLAAAVFFTHSPFLGPDWQHRYEMMCFVPLTVLLPVLAMGHIGQERAALALLLLLGLYMAYSMLFADPYNKTGPLTAGEYLGFERLHADHPGASVISPDGAALYWLRAIGFKDPGAQADGPAFTVVRAGEPFLPGTDVPLVSIARIGSFEVYAEEPDHPDMPEDMRPQEPVLDGAGPL